MRLFRMLFAGLRALLRTLFGGGRKAGGQTGPRRRKRRGRRDRSQPTEPYEPRRRTGPDNTMVPPGQLGEVDSEQITTGAFRDKSRERIVPFKLYMPRQTDSPAPVVIFSHGLGGSRHAAPYLGHALARAGYFAFFIQHPGSDASILEGAESHEEIQQRMQAAIKVPGNMVDRFSDLPFVLDQLTRMNETTKLAGKLDLGRIGMIGHSYGARSTMAAAGQSFGFFGTKFKDPRIKVGVPLSPNVTVGRGQSLEGIYDNIDIPLLHVTGSGDGMMGDEDFDPMTRTLPYQTITAHDQYLLMLDGASHSTFSGREDDGDGGEVKDVIALLVVLFMNAHLRGDVAAYDELREDFAYRLAPEDIFEFK